MILLIDNYDSFVYNLERYLIELGQEVMVFRHDAITLDEIAALTPKAIVISPGPCTPDEAGISNDLIRRFSGEIPILGVCLGHQCIGAVFGGNVIKAPTPVHGKTGIISVQLDTGLLQGLFDGLPNQFDVMRYHSLIIESETLPSVLRPTAWLKDSDIIMAVQHRDHPTYGIQFHPESVLTEHGHKMLQNFINSAILS